MEKISIGTFIAILRRLNNMTQKDLADKLRVSDKTVSHWERDESAPDLTLIPVIAEVFGVTCDELLRGERNKDKSEEYSGKEPFERTEKQNKNLAGMRKKFKTRSMISLGLSIAGLLLALLFNFGSSSAYVSFLIGCIFFMAAAICESIFYSYALYAVSEEGFNKDELNDYKMYVVHLAGKIISVPAVMFAASLALVIFPNSYYQCIEAGTWLGWGLLAVPAAIVVCMFVVYLVNKALIKKGVYTLIKITDIKRHKVNRLKVLCLTVAAAILLALILGQTVFNNVVGPGAFTSGITFDNFEDYKAYVEKGDVNKEFRDYYGPPPPGGVVDYGVDENGEYISEEQALAAYTQSITEYIYDDADNVVYQFIHLNREIAAEEYSVTGTDKFSATVYTHEQWNAGTSVRSLITIAWVFSYFAAAGVGFLVYFKKRVKLGPSSF